MKRLFAIVLGFSLYSSLVLAGEADLRISVLVLPEAEVTSRGVVLGDLARFSGNTEEYGELLEMLKTIKITELPVPKSRVSIEGEKILKAMSEQGVSLDAILYSIPKKVVVERKGKEIRSEEVVREIQSELSKTSHLDSTVRNVTWDGVHVIPIGKTEYKIELLGEAVSGSMPIRLNAYVDGTLAARFLATATVDDWKAIPMLRSSLGRGDIISREDLRLVRANLSQHPADVAFDMKEILGKRVTRVIGAGTPIRRSQIDLPPTVTSGQRIKVGYSVGGFSANTTGIALQDGHIGDEIKIRNTASKKIIRGLIKSENEIEAIRQ